MMNSSDVNADSPWTIKNTQANSLAAYATAAGLYLTLICLAIGRCSSILSSITIASKQVSKTSRPAKQANLHENIKSFYRELFCSANYWTFGSNYYHTYTGYESSNQNENHTNLISRNNFFNEQTNSSNTSSEKYTWKNDTSRQPTRSKKIIVTAIPVPQGPRNRGTSYCPVETVGCSSVPAFPAICADRASHWQM